MLFAYVYSPHATAVAPTPFADAVTAVSSVIELHSICAKDSSIAITNAHDPGMAMEELPDDGQYPRKNHGLTQRVSLATNHKKSVFAHDSRATFWHQGNLPQAGCLCLHQSPPPDQHL